MCISLEDIIKSPICQDGESLEAYTLILDEFSFAQSQIIDKQLIVKRLNISYKDTECKVLQFTDIGAEVKLKKE